MTARDIGSLLEWRGIAGGPGGLGLVRLAILGILAASFTAGVVSLYAHRYMAHGAITYLHPVLRAVLRTWIWVATGTNCRRWAALHIKHHRLTDNSGDPHSPNVASSVWRLGPRGNWLAYRRAVRDDAVLVRYRPAHAADADAWDRVLFDRPLWGMRAAYLVMTTFIGPTDAFLLWLVHSLTYVLHTATVNSLGHGWGYQRFTNAGSRYTGNSVVLSLLTAGENLHNNHHGDPMSPFLAHARWELIADWPAIVLLIWQRLNLVELNAPRDHHVAIARCNLGIAGRLGGFGDAPSAMAFRRHLREAEHGRLKTKQAVAS